MAFLPFLVKELYRCDSVVISSFVRTGYTTRRWGWLLGRVGYNITHHYPNWQKESWQTFEETSGYVRPERVNNGTTPWQIYDDDYCIQFEWATHQHLSRVRQLFSKCSPLLIFHYWRLLCLYCTQETVRQFVFIRNEAQFAICDLISRSNYVVPYVAQCSHNWVFFVNSVSACKNQEIKLKKLARDFS